MNIDHQPNVIEKSPKKKPTPTITPNLLKNSNKRLTTKRMIYESRLAASPQKMR